MDILTLSRVSKSFGENKVIDRLSFSVPTHSVFGFIGKNGAGKTTTMKMILGLLSIDSGEIFVNNEKVCFGQNKTNRYIGYLPDVPEFYGFMTSKEYLCLCGEVTGMLKSEIERKAEELLSLVGLGNNGNKRIQGFSRGMKQRLGIAQALFHSPKLLICDEPTSALDPLGRKEILDILSLVKKETTVLFSTHILSDVERICDHIAFLNHGSIMFTGTMEEIKKTRKENSLEIEFYQIEELDFFEKIYKKGKRIGKKRLCYQQETKQDMIFIMQILAQNNILVQKIEVLEPTLEDLFMEVARK